jgi:magnesium-transporting ATPase (P-type)
MNYYVAKYGKQEGPLDEATVIERMRKGKYRPKDSGIREGMSEWQPLGKLLPRGILAHTISYAFKVIAISTVAVTLLFLLSLLPDERGRDTSNWQITVIFVLHLICIVSLFMASRSINAGLAITGMLPGSIWNVIATIYMIMHLGKVTTVGGLIGLLGLDYWWLSNLYRLVKLRSQLQAGGTALRTG